MIQILPRPNIRGVDRTRLAWTRRGWRLTTATGDRVLLRSVLKPWPLAIVSAQEMQLVQARSGRVYLSVESPSLHSKSRKRNIRGRAVAVSVVGAIAVIASIGTFTNVSEVGAKGSEPASSVSSQTSLVTKAELESPLQDPCAIPLEDLGTFGQFLATRQGYTEASISQIGGLRMVVITQDCGSTQEERRLTFTEINDVWQLTKVSR